MKRPSFRRRSFTKRNGVGEFGLRGHVVEVALGNGPLYPGQVTIDPPNAYSDRTSDRDPVTETTLAVALQSLAERMDPGWAGPRRRVVLDTTRPMSLSWQSGQGLALPMTATAIATALREAVNRIHPPAHQGASHLVGGLEVVQIPSDFDGKVLVSVRNATTHRVDAGATAALEALKRSSDEYRYAVDSFDPMAGVRGLLMPVTVSIAKVRRDLEHALALAPTAHGMPRASAPKAPRAARPVARKPAGRGKASAAARKPAPRKVTSRKAAPRKGASKRNGAAVWTVTVNGTGEVYNGPSASEARRVFSAHYDDSMSGVGIAAGRLVRLSKNGVVQERFSPVAKRNGGADFGGYGADIAKGAPVRLSPHIDLYMMGDKYGTAKGAPGRDGMVSVKLDRSGRTVKLPAVALQRDYR